MTPNDLQARAIEAARDALNDSYGDVEKAIAAYEANLWCDDMDAAPRDGTTIWAYDGEFYFECWFEFGAFVSSLAYTAGLVERDDIKRWRYPPAVSGEGE